MIRAALPLFQQNIRILSCESANFFLEKSTSSWSFEDLKVDTIEREMGGCAVILDSRRAISGAVGEGWDPWLTASVNGVPDSNRAKGMHTGWRDLGGTDHA